MLSNLQVQMMLYTILSVNFASCHGPHARATGGRSFTVAEVNKLNDSPFFARIPVSMGRILVTSPTQHSTGQTFTTPEESELFFTELVGADLPPVANEIFAHGNIRLFFALDERQANFFLQKYSGYPHARRINLKELNHPTIATKWNFPGKTFARSLPKEELDVNEKQLREDLESISGARAVNVDGRQVVISNRYTIDNKVLARSWLRQQFEGLGYKVSIHKYESGTNLIAEKTPDHQVDPEMILVTAHLDTVATAGADDDGSGLITALTVARTLATKSLSRTLRFVAFDEEEKGLVGSRAYAKELKNNGEISRVAVINLEMTGYDSDGNGDFHAIDCNENTSSDLTSLLLSQIEEERLELRKIDACTTRSDHAAFWDHNRPAIVISQNFFGGDGNPCYHRSCDTVAKINFTYMAKLAKAAANATYRLTSSDGI